MPRFETDLADSSSQCFDASVASSLELMGHEDSPIRGQVPCPNRNCRDSYVGDEICPTCRGKGWIPSG